MPKIQSHGIDKNYLIKLHQELFDIVIGETTPKNKQRCLNFATMHSKVIMFGIDELKDSDFDFNKSILERYSSKYKGINQFIQENQNTRSYESFTEWLLDCFKFAEEVYKNYSL